MQQPRVVSGSLSSLVDAEARLDRTIAQAREAGEALRSAARQRATDAASTLDGELERERQRAVTAIEDATQRELCEIADDARVQIARFDAVRGERLAALVEEIGSRLIALVLAEASP